MRVRVAALVVGVVSVPVAASADPSDRFEAGGFIGIDDLGDHIALGGALAPEQRPQTAPMFGGRLTFIALRSRSSIPVDLGLEAELAFTPSWTGYGFADERRSYFAPVFGYRGDVVVRLGDGWLQPHVTAGIGGATVASSSPYMAKETDPVYIWGLGATLPFGARWQLRFDARQARMPAYDTTGMARDVGLTSTYELAISIGARLGRSPARPEPIELPPAVEAAVVQPPAPPEPEPDRDSDGDGIPDALDACAGVPELVNGIDDQDGCPEPDPDHDGLVGALDKCPDQAEDVDGFEDDDGCPDDDNDRDGVVDANDACPREAETHNGFADDDGCADELPPDAVAAFSGVSKIAFDAGKARLESSDKALLDKVAAVLLSNKLLKVTITAHPDGAGDDALQLAGKRVEAVRWYLTEQGVPGAQLTVTVGNVATQPIELTAGG